MIKIGACNLSMGALKRKSIDSILGLKFSENTVMEKLDLRYSRWKGDVLQTDPRVAQSKGVAFVKHHHWFSTQDRPYMNMCTSQRHTECLLKFRLGATDLRINDHHIKVRTERKCILCGSGQVEDELHVALECDYYRPLRLDPRWSTLFVAPEMDMKSFMAQPDQRNLASYIAQVFVTRKGALETPHYQALLRQNELENVPEILEELDQEEEEEEEDYLAGLDLFSSESFSSDSDDVPIVDLIRWR